jgi:hypothetical protein
MTPHELGQQLRLHLMRERRAGTEPDLRRLHAVIGDLCTGDLEAFKVPLGHLLGSMPLQSALRHEPTLTGPANLHRFERELEPMVAVSLRARLRPVLEGLLDLPGTAQRAAEPFSATTEPSTPAPLAAGSVAVPPPSPSRRGNGSLWLVALMSLLSGMMIVGILLLWLWRKPPQPTPGPTAEAPPAAKPDPATGPTEELRRRSPEPPALVERTEDREGSLERARSAVEQLYGSLSAKDFQQASTMHSPGVADQFLPDFFRQFEDVTVQDLRPLSQKADRVRLEGVVTYRYPDGSVQIETRTYTVKTDRDSGLITGSEFGRVLRLRESR